MHVQLWSYNYEPEPFGIAPVSAAWARAMTARGHDVDVVAAHPHYPEPRWGRRLTPYREVRDGVPVLRLPLWPGRSTAARRIRQELSFATSMALAAPAVGKPDVIVAVSPCFPALAPAMAAARARRIPWVLWVQDVLPDGAVSSGILDDGVIIKLSRRFERAAYRSASGIVVISDGFEMNLRRKGVEPSKLVRICNPATRPILEAPCEHCDANLVVLTMGNMGRTQNLVAVTRSFQESDELRRIGARFVMVGGGQEQSAVAAAIRSDRIRMTGVIDDAALERELCGATVAVVSQRYDGTDFNVPSKLMNFMAYGIPTVASVDADSEAARIITASGGGWVTDSTDTGQFARTLAAVLQDEPARTERGRAALAYAQEHFSPARSAERFERILLKVVQSR